MNYDIRAPKDNDRFNIDILIASDYAHSGYPDKKSLNDAQYARWKELAVAAFNEDNIPEAIALAKPWKYGDAAPYSRLPLRVQKGFAKVGWLYRGETGVFVMSAVSYEEGSALSELVDETKILEPITGAVHVPLLRSEQAAKTFLAGRGFQAGRDGIDHLAGVDDPVETVLMTRKKNR